ncbi:MAG TPA: hypothetical protein PKE45_16560 [Caldilineaceae bacterium]|nr:hypothetical protein [Caldilineaceae bacterium]
MLGAIQLVGLIVGVYVVFRCWDFVFATTANQPVEGSNKFFTVLGGVITLVIELGLIVLLMTYSA